jgi:hypothetical protein
LKESKVKSLSGFKPTAVRGKWFEVNDLNHSATRLTPYIYVSEERKAFH